MSVSITLTLASFDFMPVALRPALVEATPQRMAPAQASAWNRMLSWMTPALETLALARRKASSAAPAAPAARGGWGEPDPCQGGADEQALDSGEGDDGDDLSEAPARQTA